MEEDFLAGLEEIAKTLPQSKPLAPGERMEKRVEISWADILEVAAGATSPSCSSVSASKQSK
jgi:hypothetical protein